MPPARRSALALALCAIASTLPGCGVKGPLVPARPVAPESPEKPAQSSMEPLAVPESRTPPKP